MNNVYIAGTSVISSIGNDLQETWGNLQNGIVGIKPVTRFPSIPPYSFNAYQIENPPQQQTFAEQPLGPSANLLMQAIQQALLDSGLELTELTDSKVGICVGTTMGEIELLEDSLIHADKGPIKGGPHVISERLYDLLKLNGPRWTITNACAAGNMALSRAAIDISNGNADIMIVGGIDVLSWVALTGFNSLRALSPDVCRPFDVNRRGVSLGEGAGVLILESGEHLKKRKQSPKGRLLGFGFNSDAHHITQPDSQAEGAIRAMQDALEMANVKAEQIDYISAHGTGTMANDLMENKAICTLFQRRNPYVSSIKGHIGHTLGAASAIEAAISLKVLETGMIPHNQNLDEVDPKIKLKLVKDEPIHTDIQYVLSNSYAFGGINTSIVIGR